jgi:hypothetical protein
VQKPLKLCLSGFFDGSDFLRTKQKARQMLAGFTAVLTT